jgi:hypothetical protein
MADDDWTVPATDRGASDFMLCSDPIAWAKQHCPQQPEADEDWSVPGVHIDPDEVKDSL